MVMASDLMASRLHVVGAAILDGDRCLVARRAPHVAAAGFWEFPGGKVEPGEDPRVALAREIFEELGWTIVVGEFLGRGAAVNLRGVRIELDVFLATLEPGQSYTPRLLDHDLVRWVAASEIDELTWAAADVPVLDALRQELNVRKSLGAG
jgi:8-oxo-dGTP diphosphatase